MTQWALWPRMKQDPTGTASPASDVFQNLLLCWNTIKYNEEPWQVWPSGLSASLQGRVSPVQSPVRAQAWVVGQVPGGRHVGGSHTLAFLSLSSSLPSPVSKNK